MDDQTSLYLRLASTEAVSSIREKTTWYHWDDENNCVPRHSRFYSLHDLVGTYGHLTTKGTFVSNLDCETEYGCLLWIAKEYNVFGGCDYYFSPSWPETQTFVSNEFKKFDATLFTLTFSFRSFGKGRSLAFWFFHHLLWTLFHRFTVFSCFFLGFAKLLIEVHSMKLGNNSFKEYKSILFWNCPCI